MNLVKSCPKNARNRSKAAGKRSTAASTAGASERAEADSDIGI